MIFVLNLDRRENKPPNRGDWIPFMDPVVLLTMHKEPFTIGEKPSRTNLQASPMFVAGLVEGLLIMLVLRSNEILKWAFRKAAVPTVPLYTRYEW